MNKMGLQSIWNTIDQQTDIVYNDLKINLHPRTYVLMPDTVYIRAIIVLNEHDDFLLDCLFDKEYRLTEFEDFYQDFCNVIKAEYVDIQDRIKKLEQLQTTLITVLSNQEQI